MKQPPIAKLYEAYSAVADNRVTQTDSTHFNVISSDHAQHYTVIVSDNAQTFSSNDNATYWQGYPGYPILAVWLTRGLLPLDKTILPAFQNTNWHERNDVVNNKYDVAIATFLAEHDQPEASQIKTTLTQTMSQLADLAFTIKRNRASKK